MVKTQYLQNPCRTAIFYRKRRSFTSPVRGVTEDVSQGNFGLFGFNATNR